MSPEEAMMNRHDQLNDELQERAVEKMIELRWERDQARQEAVDLRAALTEAQAPACPWRFDVPDADERRARHIVAVTGSYNHSGATWHRLEVAVAGTVYEGRQGYNPDDIARIEERGGMDPGTGVVVAWMDFVTPPIHGDTRDFMPLPTPKRARAESPA